MESELCHVIQNVILDFPRVVCVADVVHFLPAQVVVCIECEPALAFITVFSQVLLPNGLVGHHLLCHRPLNGSLVHFLLFLLMIRRILNGDLLFEEISLRLRYLIIQLSMDSIRRL